MPAHSEAGHLDDYFLAGFTSILHFYLDHMSTFNSITIAFETQPYSTEVLGSISVRYL